MNIINLFSIAVLSLGTRLYLLHEPAVVVWDEAHFGKMAGWYINRTMFFDVHPPLGKMAIALAGYLTGYDGKFDFLEPSLKFNTESMKVNYIGMRIFTSVLGSMIIPLLYFGIYSITNSKQCAAVTAGLLLFDSGLITLSQYILLDPLLLFGIFGSVAFLLHFTSLQDIENPSRDRSFTPAWWLSLFLSGFLMGCAMSVKWVGILTVYSIGIWTIADLWDIWKKCKNPFTDFRNHFIARTIALIIIPLLVYATSYYIHFRVLINSGQVDSFYSANFQASLKGNPIGNLSCPLYIANGSVVTIKQDKVAMNGFLHSHHRDIPSDIMPGNLQQVTMCYLEDENNKWVMEKHNSTRVNDNELLEHNDTVKLRHLATGKYLHTIPKPSMLTSQHQIVFGSPITIDEEASLWQIKARKGTDAGRKFHVLTSLFRLWSVKSQCFLHSNSKQLPKWAAEQMEVTCTHHEKDVANIAWTFQENFHPSLKNESLYIRKLSFLEKFIEANAVQATSNAKMIPKKGEKFTKPWKWPLNLEGQGFTGYQDNDTRVYLLGTPMIWWTNCAILLIFPVLYIALHVYNAHCPKQHNEQNLLQLNLLNKLIIEANYGKWFYIFWFIHYISFYFMSRILYFHHYFPSFIFSCILTGITIDILSQIFNFYLHPATQHKSYNLPTNVSEFSLIFLLFILHNFVLYCPMSYGMTGPLAHNVSSKMYGLKLLESWDI